MKKIMIGLTMLTSVSTFAGETQVECVSQLGTPNRTVSGTAVKQIIKKITEQNFKVVSVLPLTNDGYTEEVCVTFEKLD